MDSHSSSEPEAGPHTRRDVHWSVQLLIQRGNWELPEVVNQPHSLYRLSFELADVMEDEDDGEPALTGVTTPLP